jgi:hypothetical protein
VSKHGKHVVTDSSNPEQIKKAADWQEDKARDLDYILQSKRGRRWLYGVIFDDCHAELRSHVPGDAESTAFNEGVRGVGIEILHRIKDRNFALYLAMLKEAEEDE